MTTQECHNRSEEALQRLKRGNKRFASGQVLHPGQDRVNREALIHEQHPFVTILSCADSRVPPQLIFDQGLGDLFTNRVAGNLVDETITASLAYAVEVLDVPLILVLGHRDCGAIKATLTKLERGEACEDALIRAIYPVIQSIEADEKDALNTAVIRNIKNSVEQLAKHPRFHESVQEGQLVIQGAIYNLETGCVDFLEDS